MLKTRIFEKILKALKTVVYMDVSRCLMSPEMLSVALLPFPGLGLALSEYSFLR